MRLMRFNPSVEHVPGKMLLIADALSRAPLCHMDQDTQSTEEVLEHIDSLQALWPVSSSHLDQLRSATQSDPLLVQVSKFLISGWPRSLPKNLKPFELHKNDLYTVEGLLVYHGRIVVPARLWEEMLAIIHESHQGLSKCLERVHTSLWWPGKHQRSQSLSGRLRNLPSQPPSSRL